MFGLIKMSADKDIHGIDWSMFFGLREPRIQIIKWLPTE